MVTEQWRPIPGFEGYYAVSDAGRVRSEARTIPVTGSETPRRYAERVLKQITRFGYLHVGFSVNNQIKIHRVHRLVLEAFVGPPPPGTQGCHNDGDRANNRLSNLRWDTPANNAKDAVRHGTHRQVSKTECPQGHAYDEQNTYVTRTGSRQCQMCRAEYRARRAA